MEDGERVIRQHFAPRTTPKTIENAKALHTRYFET